MAHKESSLQGDYLTLSETEALYLIALLAATLANQRTGRTAIGTIYSSGTSECFGSTPELVVDGRRVLFIVDMSLDAAKTFRPHPVSEADSNQAG